MFDRQFAKPSEATRIDLERSVCPVKVLDVRNGKALGDVLDCLPDVVRVRGMGGDADGLQAAADLFEIGDQRAEDAQRAVLKVPDGSYRSTPGEPSAAWSCMRTRCTAFSWSGPRPGVGS